MAAVSAIRPPHPPPPSPKHSLPPAPVMASSKRGNKQLQPLLFHWRSSCAQGEPSALRLNQYKRCALQPRTRVFRHPVIDGSFTQRASTNRNTFPGSPWSDQPCVNDRVDDFHPRSNQLKPLSENFSRKWEKNGWGEVKVRDLIKGKAS